MPGIVEGDQPCRRLSRIWSDDITDCCRCTLLEAARLALDRKKWKWIIGPPGPWVIMNRDHSFPRKRSVNSVWCFAKFYGSPRQITVNSAVDSQPKENQLCCSKYQIFCYLLVYISCHVCLLRGWRSLSAIKWG